MEEKKENGFTIRTATMDDLDSIAAVEAECFPAAEAATRRARAVSIPAEVAA